MDKKKLKPSWPELVRTGAQTIYLVNLLVPRMEFVMLFCCQLLCFLTDIDCLKKLEQEFNL